MPRITRVFEFDAAHRVLGHEGKCANLHGHRYVAEVTVDAPNLDKIGRVIDFSEIKTIVGNWIDEKWDHNIILHQDDPLAAIWKDVSRKAYAVEIFGKKPPFVIMRNPTAENMARILYENCLALLPETLHVHLVRLYETPKCWSDWPVHGGPYGT